MKKRSIALLCAGVMILGMAIGGTLAWLKDSTNAVTNTFTTSDVDIDLTEAAGADNDYNFKMVPGATIIKDPTVTVNANSEDCYLFVKIDKSSNYGDFLEEYTIADGWTAVPREDGVYYRIVVSSTNNQDFQILEDNTVTVKDTVTKAMMETLKTGGETTYPTLTFTAYAIQKDYLKNASGETVTDIAEIWAMASAPAQP